MNESRLNDSLALLTYHSQTIKDHGFIKLTIFHHTYIKCMCCVHFVLLLLVIHTLNKYIYLLYFFKVSGLQTIYFSYIKKKNNES